jgi:hypothetical protein
MEERLSAIQNDKLLTDTTAKSCTVPRWTLCQYIWKKTTTAFDFCLFFYGHLH